MSSDLGKNARYFSDFMISKLYLIASNTDLMIVSSYLKHAFMFCSMLIFPCPAVEQQK
jgi:hypothetical protein